MKKILSVYSIVVVTFFTACENQDVDNNDNYLEKSKLIEFTYHGTQYSSNYILYNDTILWDNIETGKLYLKLLDIPDLASVVEENGKVTFYDNFNEYYSLLEKKENQAQLRASAENIVSYGNSPVTLYLYENINKGGLSYSSNIFHSFVFLPIGFFDLRTFNPLPIPYRNYNIDDAISSLEMVYSGKTNYSLMQITLFQDPGYGGKSITFTQTNSRNNLYISNLSNYTMITPNLFRHSKSWNDQASSLKYICY